MNESIKKNGIKFGVITGLISIILTVLIYAIDLKLFANIYVGLGFLLAFLTLGIIQLKELKKQVNPLTFKDAFTAYFIGAIIGILISTAFSIILFNFIDTAARDTIHDTLISFQAEMLKKYNVPNDKIVEAINDMKENPQFSINGLLTGILKSLIGSIIFGLILSAIFKSKTNTLNE